MIIKQSLPSNPPIYTEDQEATALASYLRALETEGSVKCYTHIAHEQYTASWMVKKKNKRQGVRPGIQDYIIVTDKEVIFLELKRSKGGSLSIEQKIWRDEVNDKIAVTTVSKGFKEAKEYLKSRGITLKNENLWTD